MNGLSIFSNCTALKKISFTAETLDLESNNGVGAQFDGLATENVDLVINAKCSVQPAADGTWAGKTWKSITKVTVDADGNIVP